MRLLLTLLATLLLVLTGCGGQGTDTTATTDTPAPDEATSSPDDAADEGAATDDDLGEATEEPEQTEDDTLDEDGGDTDDGSNDDSGDAAAQGDCSAFGLDDTVQGTEEVSQDARATAAFLLDAAVRCDEQLLFTAAEESDTSFFFGSATVDEVFALPEDPAADPGAWEALARLLGGTTPVTGDADIWTWPAAAAAEADDAAWQELVDSSLYTQAQVDELRGAGEGYLGWRVGIEADGTWLFFTAGD